MNPSLIIAPRLARLFTAAVSFAGAALAFGQTPPDQGAGNFNRPLPVQPAAGIFAAKPAADFIDSIGVCAHLGRSNTNYVTRFAELKKLIVESGIRHIRSDPIQDPQATRNVRELGAAGVKFDFLVHGGPGEAFIASYLEHIRKNYLPYTESLEGLNEPDGRPAAARDWLIALRREAAKYPELARIPLLGSALAHPATSGAKVGDWSDLVDLANIHAYPGGRAPEVSLLEYVESVLPQYGLAHQYLITETGFHDALNNPPQRHKPTSIPVQAVYMPRLYLEYFRCGILRSYKYQLLDDRTDEDTQKRHQPVQEAHFGYIDINLQPKASYHAVKNLIAILNDAPGAHAAPRSLEYSITGPKELRHVLLQKADGSLYLAVWRAVSIWDPVARKDEPVASVPVTVQFPAPVQSVRLYHPTRSAEPEAGPAATKELSLSLDAEVVILAFRAP